MCVSNGTVDRALDGYPGISEKTKGSELRMADKQGYKSNLAAQSLKLGQKLHIGIVLPTHISHFFDPLRDGIRAAAEATVDVRVMLECLFFECIDLGDLAALSKDGENEYDGSHLFAWRRPEVRSDYTADLASRYGDDVCRQ